MTAYATRSQVYGRLPQLAVTSGNNTLVDEALLHTAQQIDSKIGHGWGTATAGTATAWGNGTNLLLLTPFTAIAATGAVTAATGYSVPLYSVGTNGLLAVSSTAYRARWPYAGEWEMGVLYTVAGTFGWGSAPADIVEANIVLAVRAIRSKDAGYSDVVGVEGGGAVGYNGAYPNSVKETLEIYRLQAAPLGVV